MTTLLEREDWVEAVGRSLLYDFLVRGFTYPTPDGWRELCNLITPGLAEFRPIDPELAIHFLETVDILATSDPDEVRRAHGRLFPPIESQDCPAFETAYRGSEVFQQAHIMADVAGFYRAHGLRHGGPEPERPDHITTELTFMQFLTRKEAYAVEHLGDERAEECRSSQALFLQEHLGCWAPGMGRRLAAIAPSPLFGALGLLLVAWLEHEMQSLGVEPVELKAEPIPFPSPTDESCGPATGDCPGQENCKC